MSDKYKELRKLAEKATPGRWDWADEDCLLAIDAKEEILAPSDHASIYSSAENRNYIAAANPATIRALLDERDALEKDAQRYRYLRSRRHSSIEVIGPEDDEDEQHLYEFSLDVVVDAEIAEATKRQEGV